METVVKTRYNNDPPHVLPSNPVAHGAASCSDHNASSSSPLNSSSTDADGDNTLSRTTTAASSTDPRTHHSNPTLADAMRTTSRDSHHSNPTLEEAQRTQGISPMGTPRKKKGREHRLSDAVVTAEDFRRDGREQVDGDGDEGALSGEEGEGKKGFLGKVLGRSYKIGASGRDVAI